MTVEKVKKRFRAYRSRLLETREDQAFSNPFSYIIDASNAIARGAIANGDGSVISKLEDQFKIFYWLPDDSGYGVTIRFDGIDEDGKRNFTRMRDLENIDLTSDDIQILEIQRPLSLEQIESWGGQYNVPTQAEIKKKFQ